MQCVNQKRMMLCRQRQHLAPGLVPGGLTTLPTSRPSAWPMPRTASCVPAWATALQPSPPSRRCRRPRSCQHLITLHQAV